MCFLFSPRGTFLSLVVAVSALVAAGCGDDSGAECGAGTELIDGTCRPTVACGDGTVPVDGECVPDNTVTCGAGTAPVDGECVPDGSVICDQGTTFDPESGSCVVDPTACAEGTVLIGGQCVANDDALEADVTEGPEAPGTAAGRIQVPELDGMTTIGGCIAPVDGVEDRDPWILEADGPALLEITADGVGGLAAGFVFADADIPALPNFLRFGVNLTGDTSKRQIFVPVAGTYVLEMADSRSLLSGEAAGSEDTCYFTTIHHVALPAAAEPTLPRTSASHSGDVAVYGYTATNTGDILDLIQTTDSPTLRPAFVVRKNGEFARSGAFDPATGTPPFATLGSLELNDQIEIIIDPISNIALTPQEYALELFAISAQALPSDGSTLELVKRNDRTPTAPHVDFNYSYFDVPNDGDVMYFDMAISQDVTMIIVRRDIFTEDNLFDRVATLNTRDSFSGEFIRFAEAGRYYLISTDLVGTAGDTYSITSTLVAETPTTLAYGDTATAQAVTTSGTRFFTVDVEDAAWIELAASATNWGTDNQVRLRLYDLAGTGWLQGNEDGGDYELLQTSLQPADGSAPAGRITLGDDRSYLVRVDNTGLPAEAPTFDLSIGDRDFVALGTLEDRVPVVRTDADATAAGATTRYLALGTVGHRLEADVAPVNGEVDIQLHVLAPDESSVATANAGDAGAAETATQVFAGEPAWVAFAVENIGDAETTLNVTAEAIGPLAFEDVCQTGTVLDAPFNGSADDDFSPVFSLPFSFDFFGAPQTQFVLSSNGLIAFGDSAPICGSAGCFRNLPIPSPASPSNFIAGYWDDLQNVTACRKDEADSVTLQYTGNVFGSTAQTVQFQVVLNSSGQIDLIYGPNHAATGASATIGAESASGELGIELGFNQDGATPANSSSSFSTAP